MSTSANPDVATSPPPPTDDALSDLGRSNRLFRFLVIGGIGFVVNTVIVALLINAGLADFPSSVIATEVAILGNYVGHELFTFGTRAFRWRRLLGYNAAAMLGLLITSVAFAVIRGNTQWPLVLANLAAVACGTGSNFLVSSRFVWRER